jgi:hypothetical protein
MNNNPLRQYFRRPAVYIKLPSGCNHYHRNVVEPTETEEFPVYPMTAIDEITVKTPDALYNGTAIVEIVKSCVPNIKDPWNVNSVDLDAILIAIRAASAGDKFEIETTCPKCEETSKYDVQLAAVLSSINPAVYNEELPINELNIKFRPMTYKEMNETNIKQLEVQKIFNYVASLENETEQLKKTREAVIAITELTMEVVTKTIQHIRTPNGVVEEKEFILDYLRNCDKRLYAKIRDHNSNLREKTAIKPFDVTCLNCGNEYKQPFTVNYSDFFE